MLYSRSTQPALLSETTGTEGVLTALIRKRCETRQEAVDAQVELRSGKNLDAPRTVKDAIRRGEPILWRGKRWEKHARKHLAFIEGVIGERPLASLSRSDLDAVVTALHRKGCKAATRNRYISSLHRLLAWCLENEFILTIPKFPRREREDQCTRYLTADEEAELLALLRAWGRADVVDFVMVGIDTCMRLGEILATKPEHLKGPRQLHIAKSRTGTDRMVWLTPRASEVLNRRAERVLRGTRLFAVPESNLRYWWDSRARPG